MARDKQYFTNILFLNLAVLFISTSGVLGRYITLDPVVIIFYRTLIAAVVFYILIRWRKISLKIESKRDLLKIILGGFLFGAHWITYFYSLQLSNVAIGLLSLFTYPVITAFLEPILLKTSFNKIHLALGVLVLAGIYLLSPDLDFENDYFIAVILGVISSVFYALRNILMKNQISKYNGTTLMFYQIVTICICLSPVLFFSEFTPVITQWKPLLILAILTTCIGHTLFLNSFRNFTVTAASIMSSIQPVYGILLAIIFLDEVPQLMTILGGILIISAVVIENLVSYKKA
ncbi:EamA family transporter [Christiangramia fulva]|uniref:EamA family transporter n=1 Tax=Christiangramia fulva TaxID=2126553 RepID=A0A2R3Z9I5_9FLAO|nr:DMT family transporter [Christiangramia fulva]AVR46955.1 EamA family transporter [Christiangramia fulva]